MGRNHLNLRPPLTASRRLLRLAAGRGHRLHATDVVHQWPRCRPFLTPKIQTVIVEHNIAGIKSCDEYIDLRNASPEVEKVFTANLQATLFLQKNMGALRKSVRDFKLVAEFVENHTVCPMINYVKENVFGRSGGLPLVPRTHHVLGTCFDHPCPPLKGTLLSFVNEFPPTLTSLRVLAR